MCKRNIDQLPLAHPQLGTWPATQACALTGNQTSNLSVSRLVLNPLSHTSQGSTFLKYTIPWHLVHLRWCTNHHHYLVPKYFITPKEIFYPSAVTPYSSPPSPWQPFICFLSLWILLFRILHINRIIKYATSCIWFLSLSMFSRCIHVLACISA